MGPENITTQIDGIGVIHLTIAIRPEICGLVDAKIEKYQSFTSKVTN